MSNTNPNDEDGPGPESFRIRKPALSDAAAITDLVHRTPLDDNSLYAYLLMCHHFADTCVVAEWEGSLVGFITGYRPPRQPDTLFVWQVAVDSSARGTGLASRMLDQLLSLQGENGGEAVRFVEATVTPDNQPSQRLFRKLAERYQTQCETGVLFPKHLFGEAAHEDEVLFRIGPIG